VRSCYGREETRFVDLGNVLAHAGGRAAQHTKRRNDGGWVVEANKKETDTHVR